MSIAASRPTGPAAAASRSDVLAVTRRRWLAGDKLEVRAIAAELGLGRATVYRWFGSRDALVGEVIATESERYFRQARTKVRGHGAAALLETFDRINRGLSRSPALRSYLEQEREAALRLLTSTGGPVAPRAVAAIRRLIEEEAAAGHYRPPVEPETLA